MGVLGMRGTVGVDREQTQSSSRVNVLPWLIAECLHKSRKSLDRIGEGDWTPQDAAHLALVQAVEAFFASEPHYRTGQIIHGDAE